MDGKEKSKQHRRVDLGMWERETEKARTIYKICIRVAKPCLAATCWHGGQVLQEMTCLPAAGTDVARFLQNLQVLMEMLESSLYPKLFLRTVCFLLSLSRPLEVDVSHGSILCPLSIL